MYPNPQSTQFKSQISDTIFLRTKHQNLKNTKRFVHRPEASTHYRHMAEEFRKNCPKRQYFQRPRHFTGTVNPMKLSLQHPLLVHMTDLVIPTPINYTSAFDRSEAVGFIYGISWQRCLGQANTIGDQDPDAVSTIYSRCVHSIYLLQQILLTR